MKHEEHHYFILFMLGLIPVIWFGLLIAPYISDGLIYALPELTAAIYHPFHIVWCKNSLKMIGLMTVIYICGAGIVLSNRRNYRRNVEYGSAKWGDTKKVNQKYASKDFTSNKILSQNVRIGLDGKKHRRNLNTIIIGGSGAGKTRFYCKPNIMQCNTSFVCLDPKGGARRSYMKSVRTSQI